MHDRRERALKVLLLVAGILSAWGVALAVSNGVSFSLGPVRISSRDPSRPLLLGAAVALIYIWGRSRLGRSGRGESERDPHRRLLTWMGVSTAISVVLLGMLYGTEVAGGADPYGYISEAELLLAGHLRVTQPWVAGMPWPDADWTFAPIGFRPGTIPHTIVPLYPPGLPLLIAAWKAILPAQWPLLLIPCLGAVLIVSTFLLARDASGSSLAGLLASLFLASSPTVLFLSMWTMSDVPTAALWTLSFWLAFVRPTPRPFLAGLAAAIAVLIRPNLAPLAAVAPLVWLASRSTGARSGASTASQVAAFALGLAPGVLAVAGVNAYLHGAPWRTGYGDVRGIFAMAYAPVNLRNYWTWITETQTLLFPLALLALARPSVLQGDRNRWEALRPAFLAIVVLTLLSYVFYIPLEAWWYLRFLLPGFPIAAALLGASIVRVCRPAPPQVRPWLMAMLCAPCLVVGARQAVALGAFNLRPFEHRYVEAAQAVEALTPPGAIIVSLQHSGSVRYYGHRVSLRYDLLPPEWLDRALLFLRDAGHPTYVLLEAWEETEFRRRFGAVSAAGRLTSKPLAEIPGSIPVRLYALPPDARDAAP